MGLFGKRVIGEAAAKAEATKEKVGATIWGKRVVGSDMAKAGMAADAKPITASKAPAPPPPTEETNTPASPSGDQTPSTSDDQPGYSVTEIQDMLAANPAVLDELLEAEGKRPDGPRRGAVRAMLDCEMGRQGGPRQAVVEQLSALLKPREG